MECIICAYTIDGKERLRTLTTCGHEEPICSICYLRLRSLQRNFHCPTCKRELDNVICAKEDTSKYSDYIIRNRITIDNVENYFFDPKGQIFFPKDYYDEHVKSLWTFQCHICQQTRKDFKQLRGHMINEHNIHMCNLCGENKQVFPGEHKHYNQQQYDQHIRYGDKDGSNGHPLCEFCKKRFYDSSALFFHLRKDHFTCHLCENQGIKFVYYNDYKDLEHHFQGSHFLCDDPSCLERRFVVFSNEIDLFAHRRTYHPSLITNQAIPLHFQFKKSDNVVNAIGERVGDNYGNDSENQRGNPYNEATRRERFEGGLGGRAVGGEWQVELQPMAADPRDPNRYLQRQRQVIDKDDFPELPPSASGPVLGNRWISVKESNGSSKSGKGGASLSAKLKGQGNDFPSLPMKDPASTKPKSTKISAPKKAVAKDLSSNDMKGIMSYVNSLAEDEPFSNRPPTVVDSLGNWVNVKVDKRLQKKKKKPTANASTPNERTPLEEDGEEEEEYYSTSANTSGKVNTYQGNRGTEGWNSTGFIDTQESFSFDLAKALHDSLEEFDNKQVEAAKEVSKQEYQQKVDYPTLAAPSQSGETTSAKESTSSKNASTKSSTSTKAKPAKADDWSSALKSVGLGVNKKPKKSAGITVVKANSADANKKLTASIKREDVNSAWRNNVRESEIPTPPPGSAGPPPAPLIEEGMTSSSKKYGGWVRIGGSGDRSPPVNLPPPQDNPEFPGLSSKSKK